MDLHDSLPEGVTAGDIAQAHAADLRIQDRYGVKNDKYWVDLRAGKFFASSKVRPQRQPTGSTGSLTDFSLISSTRSRRARREHHRRCRGQEKVASMSDHVIYVDRFQLREGKAEDFKRYATDMAEFVEENEPGVMSFNYYMDEDGAKGTAVFVFSDAEAADLHLDLASSRVHDG